MCGICAEEVMQNRAAEKVREEEEENSILFSKGGKIFVVRDKMMGGREVLQIIEIPPGAMVIIQKESCDCFLEEA